MNIILTLNLIFIIKYIKLNLNFKIIFIFFNFSDFKFCKIHEKIIYHNIFIINLRNLVFKVIRLKNA